MGAGHSKRTLSGRARKKNKNSPSASGPQVGEENLYEEIENRSHGGESQDSERTQLSRDSAFSEQSLSSREVKGSHEPYTGQVRNDGAVGYRTPRQHSPPGAEILCNDPTDIDDISLNSLSETYPKNVDHISQLPSDEDFHTYVSDMSMYLTSGSETNVKKSVKPCSLNEVPYMVEAFQPLIEQTVNVRDILPHLPFLDAGEFQNQNSPREAVELLIARLFASEECGKWQAFLHALNEEEYEYIVRLLRGDTEEDQSRNRYLLKLFKPKIMRRIEPEDFINNLFEQGVITDRDMEEVRAEEARRGATAASLMLLDKVPRRACDWFQVFLKVLKKCGMEDIAKELDEPVTTQTTLEPNTKHKAKTRKRKYKFLRRRRKPKPEDYLTPTYEKDNQKPNIPPLPADKRTPNLPSLPADKRTPNLPPLPAVPEPTCPATCPASRYVSYNLHRSSAPANESPKEESLPTEFCPDLTREPGYFKEPNVPFDDGNPIQENIDMPDGLSVPLISTSFLESNASKDERLHQYANTYEELKNIPEPDELQLKVDDLNRRIHEQERIRDYRLKIQHLEEKLKKLTDENSASSTHARESTQSPTDASVKDNTQLSCETNMKNVVQENITSPTDAKESTELPTDASEVKDNTQLSCETNTKNVVQVTGVGVNDKDTSSKVMVTFGLEEMKQLVTDVVKKVMMDEMKLLSQDLAATRDHVTEAVLKNLTCSVTGETKISDYSYVDDLRNWDMEDDYNRMKLFSILKPQPHVPRPINSIVDSGISRDYYPASML